MLNIDTKYSKEYRMKLGFTNQGLAKEFFAAKDIIPSVDFDYINSLNQRLSNILEKINSVVSKKIASDDVADFFKTNVSDVFLKLRDNNVISKLNNQGRRPEEVYFSWMRGHVISKYFSKGIAIIFQVDDEDVKLIGDDDIVNIDNFKRTPKADLEINLKDGNKIRIEVQSGFQGVNDIKQHKVLEAKKIKIEHGLSSWVMHFDLFNGQVAFVQLDQIEDESVNWITRQQMEGQTVFNIDQNYFVWKLTEEPVLFSDLINE